eukprot:2539271-Prymnesium_polylepis.1
MYPAHVLLVKPARRSKSTRQICTPTRHTVASSAPANGSSIASGSLPSRLVRCVCCQARNRSIASHCQVFSR